MKSILKTIKHCILYVLFFTTIPITAQTVTATYTEGQGSSTTVSNTDLLQTKASLTASSGSFTNEGTAGTAVLKDGSASMASSGKAGIGSGSSLTYTLTGSATGFDITSIDIFSTWGDGNRLKPNVVVSYSLKATPSVFVTLTTVTFNPTMTYNAIGCWTKSSLAITGLEAVGALKFEFPNQQNGYVGYNEIDVFGKSNGVDTQAPTTPANLTKGLVTSTSVVLSWTASTDNNEVTAYDIYAGANLIGTTANTTYTASQLASATQYSFTVKAKDAANNTSAASTALVVSTTPNDNTAPSVPQSLIAGTITPTSVVLNWSASTDNIGVVRYDIYKNATLIGTSASPTFTATGLAPSTTFRFTVSAVDAEGNTSNVSTALEVSTLGFSAYSDFTTTLNSGTGWSGNWTDTGGWNDMKTIINPTGLSFGALNVSGGSKDCNNESTRYFTPITIPDGDSICFSYLLKENSKHFEFRILSDGSFTSNSGHEGSFYNFNGSNWVGTSNSTTTAAYGTTTFNLIVLKQIGSNYTAKRFVYSDPAKLPARMPSVGDANAFYSGTYTSANLVDITNIKGVQTKMNYGDPGQNLIDEIRVGHSFSEVAFRNPPVAPTNLSASILRQSSFTLSWNLSANDLESVDQCEVYKNGVSIGSVKGTSMKITGLTPSTTYNFTVKAKIGTNIASPASTALSVTTTAADVQAPTVPQNLNYSNLTQSSFTLTWDASTDNVDFAGYEVFKDNVSVGTTTNTSMNLTGLTPSTSYSMTVKAIDAVGNISTSAALSVTTNNPDLTAPTQPTNLVSSLITQTGVTLTWTGSTDNIGVESYQIYKNGTLVNNTTATTIAITGLSSSTNYKFTVKAKDAAGNLSVASNEVSVTTTEFVQSPTGFIENFNDNNTMGWYAGTYGLSAQNGVMKIVPVKGSIWDGFGFQFADVDLRNNPFVSLKIKSNFDFNLSMAVGKVGGKIDTYPIRMNTIGITGAQEIAASSEFQEYSIDFTGVDAAVLAQVNNIHIVLNPFTRMFGEAPNKEIYFDDLKIGEIAVHTPSITTLPNQVFTTKATGTTKLIVPFRGVTDGGISTNAITVKAISSNPSCIPDPVVTYTSPSQNGSLELNPVVTSVGESTISVIVSAANTTDKTMTFKVKVVPNNSPSMKQLPDLMLKKGAKKVIDLSNIFDGNSESTQKIQITASASTPANFTDNSIKHDSTDFKGTLSITPSLTATAGAIETITVKLKDDGGVANGGVDEATYTFKATLFDDVNNAPTLDSLPPKAMKAIVGAKAIILTGISDGDNKNQVLTFETSATSNTILTDLSVGEVVNGTAPFNFKLTGETGSTTITVKITDNGGSAVNNGNQSIERKFTFTTVPAPITGLVADYTPFIGNVAAAKIISSQSNSTVNILNDGTVHIHGTVLQQTFPANWFDLSPLTGGKDLDISANKKVSFKVKCPSTNKYEAPAGVAFDSTTIHFRLIDHTQPGQPGSGFAISTKKVMVKNDGLWHDIYLDYSGLFYKDNNGGQTDSTRITKLMLDINCTWFQQVTGDYYFKDMKFGDLADKPATLPHPTVGKVSDQVLYKGEIAKPVKLSGITDGKGNQTANLTATTNKTNMITNISIGNVINGTAQLSYTVVPNVVDSAIITVIANNTTVPQAIPDTMSFRVFVVDTATVATNYVNINLSKTFQTVAGLGTMMANGDDDEQVQNVKDLNITVMRFTASGEFEPVNDNADPNVTDYSNFNRAAIPTATIRRINEETNCHKFFYTSWTPANWMKQNKAEYPDPAAMWAGNNKLKPEMMAEFAEYLVAICKTVKEEAGVELYAISPQNEPTFNEPYSSCQVSGTDFRDLMRILGPRLKAEGLNTRIMMPEDIATQMMWVTEKIDPVLADPIAKDYIGVMAVHLYDPDGINVGGSGSSRWKDLLTIKKSTVAEGLWMTETSGFSNIWEGQWTKDYMSGRDQFNPGPLDYAGSMFTAFKEGQLSGWTDFDGANHKIANDLYGSVFKNYSKYVQPSAVMVDAISTSANILSLSFKNPDNSLSTILLNTSRKPMKVTLKGTNVPKIYRIFTTQNYAPFKEGTTVTTGSVVLPPRSISTLYYSTSNLAPTVDTKDNVSLLLDKGDSTITVTGIGYGADPITQNITKVEVTSTNATVATADVTYVPNSTTAKIAIHPVNYGTTQLIVKIKDDGGVENGGIDSTLMKFYVNVTSKMNTVPTINLQSAITLKEDADSTRLKLTGISDGDNFTQQLTFTVTSSNQTIIANPRISYTQGKDTATLIFSSLPNTNGLVDLTIIASDNGGDEHNNGNLTAKIVVPVNVLAVNDVPKMTSFMSNEKIKVGIASRYIFDYEDGDPEMAQTVNYSVRNSNPSVLTATLLSIQEGRFRLSLMGKAAGSSTVVVIIKDNGGILNGGIDSLVTSYLITVESTSAINTINDNLLSIYPNPVNEYLMVTLSEENPDYYFITDLSGQIVDKNSIADLNGRFKIKTGNLSRGMYFITVKSGNNSRTLKFIRQ